MNTDNKIEEINKEINVLETELGQLENQLVLTTEELKREAEIRKAIKALKKEKIAIKSKKLDSNFVLYSVSAIALLITIINLTLYVRGLKADNKADSTVSTPVVFAMAEPTNTPAPDYTIAPTVTPEVEKLFEDVTSEEQVIARAQKIYDIDLKPILEELDNEQLNSMVTIESLTDIIRMSLGQLPVNEEYETNSVDNMFQHRNKIFGNMGSDPNLSKLYPSHYSNLAPDNSELSNYMASYDELYNNIAKARNENNVETFVENVEELGYKHYNEWVLGGLYGGFNPYLIDEEHKQLALAAADDRYSSYVLEYLLSNNLNVCIPACYDPVSGEYKKLSVIDIEEAIYLGRSMNGKVSLSYYGEKQPTYLSTEFYWLLANKLNDKALTLKRG